MTVHNVVPEKTDPRWRDEMGGYNQFPPNWQEIDPDEFWRTMSHQVPRKIETRQMYGDKSQKVPPLSATLIYFGEKEGLAYTVEWVHKPFTPSSEDSWQPTYYRFAACIHDWEALPQRYNCLHESKCKKCGLTSQVDSSG